VGFFFQAEDGIRDGHVTGVQTCALPISPRRWPARKRRLAYDAAACRLGRTAHAAALPARCGGSHGPRAGAGRRWRRGRTGTLLRSEERRVGKEWRGAWAADQERESRRRQ